jgi:DNA-binding CsgD family transcriptional regulator
MMDNLLFNDFTAIENEDDLLLLLDKVVESLALDGFLFAYAINGWLPSGEPGEIQRWISNGIDKKSLKGWLAPFDIVNRKDSDVNRRFDPIRRFMVQQTIPHQFLLTDIVKDSHNQYTLVEKRWIKSLIKNNVVNLISIPVQLPPSEYWSLSFFSNNTLYKLTPIDKAQLMLFAHQLVYHCVDVLQWRDDGMKDSIVKLSAREKDCLYWSAQGKTASEIADILGLKTETVRKYIKNVMKRLNARSKTQAVVKAIKFGLLDIGISHSKINDR